MKFDKFQKNLRGIGIILILLAFHHFVVPRMSLLLPQQFKEVLDNQVIDSRALFYSGSDQALKGYYEWKTTGKWKLNQGHSSPNPETVN